MRNIYRGHSQISLYYRHRAYFDTPITTVGDLCISCHLLNNDELEIASATLHGCLLYEYFYSGVGSSIFKKLILQHSE